MASVVCPLAMAGCVLLFISLDHYTIGLFFGWFAVGMLVYFAYARSRSLLGIANDAAGIK
jgi:basic amino acid/polyamine antiporter, APA family